MDHSSDARQPHSANESWEPPDDKPGHRIMIVRDGDELGRTAATIVARTLRDNPRAVLALPTGNTPLPMYRWLVRMHGEGAVDFSAARTFNLDEFYGLSPENPASFAAYMHRELFCHVSLGDDNVNLLNPLALDAQAECRDYERRIRQAGGIDLAILGIGRNGHIAFNEPGSAFDSRTRLIRLATSTIRDSRRFFDGSPVPPLALTMGIGTIMEARQVLLLASGRKKARILARSLLGEVSVEVPASVLQRHPALTVIIDQQAAAGLAGESRPRHCGGPARPLVDGHPDCGSAA